MARAKITTKGQVTLPKAIRDELGLRPGDVIDFVREGTHIHVQKVVGESPFERWSGYLKHLDGVDIDEMIEDWRGR